MKRLKADQNPRLNGVEDQLPDSFLDLQSFIQILSLGGYFRKAFQKKIRKKELQEKTYISLFSEVISIWYRGKTIMDVKMF